MLTWGGLILHIVESPNSQLEKLITTSLPHAENANDFHYNGSGYHHGLRVTGLENARFAYVTLGSLVLIGGFLFLAAFLRDRSRPTGTLSKEVDSVHSTTRNDVEQSDPSSKTLSEKEEKTMTGDGSMKNDR